MGDVEEAIERDSSIIEPVVERDSSSIIETDDEYEYPDYKSEYRDLFVSLARQFYCFCSVMMLPVFSTIIDVIPPMVPYNEIKDKFKPKWEEKINNMKYLADITIASTIGLIIGGVLLCLIGRKFTVLAVNLSNLMILLYSYVMSYGHLAPYKVTLAHHVISRASFMAYFIYVAEISSPTFRAFFMGLYQFCDILVEGITSIQTETLMSRMLLFGSTTAAFSSLLALYIPETPFWLTVKGNPERAEEIFSWLRAGNSGTTEFDQMQDKAEQKGMLRQIFSQTFIVAVIFSVLIVITAFDPCFFVDAVVYGFHYPKKGYPKLHQFEEMVAIMNAWLPHKFPHAFYGQLIFLLSNFVAPRKLLYFLSYIIGVLITVPIGLKTNSGQTMMMFASYCSFSPYMGLYSLIQILPTEIYPIALREVGVALTVFLRSAYFYIFLNSYAPPKPAFPRKWVYQTMSWFNVCTALIGIPFILVFMPETRNVNIYELDELKLSPFGNQGIATADEDEDTMDENATELS